MTIKSFPELLQDRHFVTIAEIAARRDSSPQDIIMHAKRLYDAGIDIVSFSDQAFAKSQYLQLSELLELNVFTRLPRERIIPILKTKNKEKREINKICEKLKKQNVRNLFIVTGDLAVGDEETLNDSLAVIPKLSDGFFMGAVAHPQKKDIPRTILKIKAGARFLIVQASYDTKEWEEWVQEVKKQKIHKMVPIIAAVVPLTSQHTLSAVRKTKDISISKKILNEFINLEASSITLQKGIDLTRKMIVSYKKSGIFSGIYTYNRLPKVVAAVLHGSNANIQ